ncbi:MAG: MoaD/ThiS family protein [Chloroflexi bacterium]|nr:MoaD/ThiS family protein [Chloroflexota bacterium]
MAVVWIPPLLRHLTGGTDKVTVPGRTLRHVLNSLEEIYPGFKAALLEENEEQVQSGIVVVVDGEASQMGLIEPVGEKSEIHFVPAISGG